MAAYLRETADNWNDNIERWTYATDSDLARQIGVEGYYVRIAPPETDCAPLRLDGFVPIKNRPPGKSSERSHPSDQPGRASAGALRTCVLPTIREF